MRGYHALEMRTCPRCKGSGTVHATTPSGPYQPVGLKICSECNGVGAVAGRDS